MVKYVGIKRNGSVTFMGRTRTYHIFLSDDEKKMLYNAINNKMSKENADFIVHMEDILDVYEMPYNPQIPVVCMDENTSRTGGW